ncbi:MAG: alkaline phosphatase, partial [Phycisphaerae bacterium]|nr:alkaline phosphatase [Phycisphaerae bacterium]
GTHWYHLMSNPNASHGFFETHSLSSVVTDSAAAAAAWASGSRVCSSSLNVLPDGTHLTPIGHLVHDSGRAMGLVTTTSITNATPAAFGAVCESRHDQQSIAAQYLGKIDVLMGGGIEQFQADNRDDDTDLLGKFREAGYVIWQRRDELQAQPPRKIAALFTSGHLPYTLDWQHDAALQQQTPTLAEMTKVALESLNSGGQGFLLQVEGGRVDHAAHLNDAAALVWDQLAFDDAIGVVLEFMQANPETLLVITSDHGCANPGLNGTGNGYLESNHACERLAAASGSYVTLADRIRAAKEGSGGVSVDAVRQLVKEVAGIELSEKEGEAARAALMKEELPEIDRQHTNWVGMVGQALGNHTCVGWTGTCHTEDLVVLTALGPGQERFQGVQRNTAAYDHMTALFDIDHRNRSMTPEEAGKYLTQLRPETDVHWV